MRRCQSAALGRHDQAAAVAQVDNGGTHVPFNDLTEALHTLTTVRALVASGLSSGLRNDAPDRALSMRQRWRLAEIRCEDYAFMLLSRVVNLLDTQVRALTCRRT